METGDDDKGLLNQALALNAVKAVGPGDEEPDSQVEAFLRACGDYLRAWQRAHKEERRHKQLAPAMFIFSPSQLPEIVWPAAQKAQAFKNTCALQLGGSLFVCNENLRLVFQADVGFKNEGDALKFLDDNGLQSCAAVVFLPQQDALLVHEPNEDPNDAVRIDLGPVSSEPFSFDKLDEYLKRFYADFLETHDGDCDIWAKATKRQLKPEPERQIQKSLNAFFKWTIGRYGAKLDQEIKTRRGRSDLRVLRYHSPTEWRQAIMELKVLRPGNSPNARDWALKGIDQLVGYRKGEEEQTEACYLCCYDARPDDQDILEVQAAAQVANVLPRRYFMKTPGCGL